jgi:hypothetical protein
MHTQCLGVLKTTTPLSRNRLIQLLFLDLEERDQTLRHFPAGALLLVFAMPLDTLIERCLGRHWVLGVPEFVH